MAVDHTRYIAEIDGHGDVAPLRRDDAVVACVGGGDVRAGEKRGAVVAIGAQWLGPGGKPPGRDLRMLVARRSPGRPAALARSVQGGDSPRHLAHRTRQPAPLPRHSAFLMTRLLWN